MSESHKSAHLIQSDDAEPKVTVKPGMKFEVRTVTVVDTDMKPGAKIAARLCGSDDTCVALFEV
jgi:hypothetical protein